MRPDIMAGLDARMHKKTICGICNHLESGTGVCATVLFHPANAPKRQIGCVEES
jgi:hypothetical protein